MTDDAFRPPVCLPSLAATTRSVLSGVCSLLVAPMALAAPCADIGLDPASAAVMQLREAAQPDRPVTAYRDTGVQYWFVPLAGKSIGDNRPDRMACTADGLVYWKLQALDAALAHNADDDVLSFLDTSQVTGTIDNRKPGLQLQAATLDSLGLNYQLGLNYAGTRFNPGAFADVYAYTQGWNLNTSLSMNSSGKISRYSSYALKESLDTGTFLRLGDAITFPGAMGESLQFAGVSWGTDRNLRPGDFAPVLPTLRNGNALSGPLEVFINDTLQFQQLLQTGVYDLRNLPAQQGFNSYTVRTLDALGNPVTVQREIYLPASLLPPGISSWRLEAGFQREDFFTANAHYGAPLASASYATGVSQNVTLGGRGLASKEGSTASFDYDQRLSDLWTGHLGLITAKNAVQEGQALQVRVDGGSRWWRLLADFTHAFQPLPGLGNRAALLMQRLVRAQWSGIPGWNLGLTLVQSQRESVEPEKIATLTVSTRVADNGANLMMGLTQTRSAAGRQNGINVALFMPLSRAGDLKNRSFYASQNSVDGAQVSRAQYSSSGQSSLDTAWGMGVTRDSRPEFSSVDANWGLATDKLDLAASARAAPGDTSGQVSLRSGLVWTGGSVFASRAVTGSFAMVSTGEEGVAIFLENRPVGQTNPRGMLLVPGLRAFESNRLSVDPATWPLHWMSRQTDQQVIPPRGGVVLVSFRINAQSWPHQTMLVPTGPDGRPYPAGTVVSTEVDREVRETVINGRGQLWLGELMPTKTFSITFGGRRCEFEIPDTDGTSDVMPISPRQCQSLS